MFRGTTPTHTFEVDMITDLIKTIKITYYQNDKEILVKRTEDCSIQDGIIQTKLSQEDTFLFNGNMPVMIYIRVLTIYGDAMITEPVIMAVRQCLDDEVLV
jgi:hypothetical protein